MSTRTWKDTQLYKLLSTRNNEYDKRIANLVENPDFLDTIENVLNNGGTTPKNFTLHNADHSFRVAEQMWFLIPDETKFLLSGYEIGLLLMSAYLHDIGMSPSFDKVENHKLYIENYDKNTLTVKEALELQKWIDNNDKIANIDVSKEIIENEETSQYIIAYYTRYKHNDWSEDWIRNNLPNYNLYSYPDWKDDLILICKSHHFGISHLVKNEFDLKSISQSLNVHLRYLSICLRVADVIENDPERTPEVILSHRSIDNDSLVYWLKDKCFTLLRTDNSFTVRARPDKAYLHKAILETAKMIENELKLCEELLKLKPLNQSLFIKSDYYKWDFNTYVHRDIRAKDDLYTYIQGSFRPNTQKILELLGGNQLYGDSIWAFREIIQNSFDAIKEKIAYQIINEERDYEEEFTALSNLHSINIYLEERSDGYWLICKDQGVGMNREIIENFFLESGSSKRHEISELERRSKAKGFDLGRTGQFGIGVLSYFMLAEKLLVKTKRQLNTGYNDNESIAWRFEINGTHDFGELNRLSSTIIGTTVELKLNKTIQDSISGWNNNFRKFIENNILVSPCKLTYQSEVDNTQFKIERSGWVRSTEKIKLILMEDFSSSLSVVSYNELMTKKKQSRLEEFENFKDDILLKMSSSLDFLYIEEKIDNLGSYRVFIPYFRLREGNSFYFFNENSVGDKNYISKINEGHIWIPVFSEINFSLKGIAIAVSSLDRYRAILMSYDNCYIELDINNIDNKNHLLSISRHEIRIKNIGEALLHIRKSIENKINESEELFSNKYDSLNSFVTKKNTYIQLLAFS